MAVTPAWIRLPDRYRVIGHIANGGMASVWEAHDELLGRDVAVKLLAPHLSEDERARTRFMREARMAAGLSTHPHVVTIYDVGECEGRSFIVMELLRGGTVADRVRGGRPVDRETALRWLGEAAEALDGAHAADIVHRDIKPANLLLDDRDRLAVADFGIARLALEDQLTATGVVLGTASYISPEQAVGDPSTAASDRYALAVVAYELLAGSKPFDAEHFAAQARMHIEDPPPAAPGLPAAASAVLQRGMAKDPERRWPTAVAMVDALEDALEPRPATAATAALPPTRPNVGVARAPAERPRTPPSPWPLALALLGGAAVIAAVLAIALGDGEDQTPTREPAAQQTAEPAAEPRDVETPAPERTSAPPAARGGDLGEARGLHNQAFAANNAGDFARAEQLERQVLETCRGAAEQPIDPCGYALYDLGRALNGMGRHEDAAEVLRQRLERFGDNSSGDVARELRIAESGGAEARRGNGRAKGNKKGSEDD